MRRWIAWAVGASAFFLVGCGNAPAPAASPNTSRAAAERSKTFDHSAFSGVLKAHVSDSRVDYQALTKGNSEQLAGYLRALGEARPDGFADRDDELAFWLNAYNACVITAVLERYPNLSSVMDIEGFFTEKRWKLAGSLRSLDDMEALIREFGDPRVHFVLVCASVSCPPLQDEAMAPERLDSQLENATSSVVNSTKYVQIEPEAKVLRMTRILSWYRDDFIRKYGTPESFLIRYLEEPKRSQLKEGGYRFEYMEYDWALNDARGSARQ